MPLEYIRLIRVLSFCRLVEQASSNRFTSVPKAKTLSRGKASNNFLPSSTLGPVWAVPHEETMRTVKLVVIGSSGVGKTSLRNQVRP